MPLIAGEHHHPNGDYKTGKTRSPESIYKNHRTLAWCMLIMVVVSVIGAAILSFWPDDDPVDDSTEQVDN